MAETIYVQLLMSLVVVLGYLAIIFEHKINVNKTVSALLTAVISWSILFVSQAINLHPSFHLEEFISGSSQIILFLLGAMAIVELIDSHKGFKIIVETIGSRSKKMMLFVVGILAFFLSSVLDNLTTTILMISLLRKLIKEKEDRWLMGAAVVIAANSGGAWTPIGDVTTTMLWIQGQISTFAIMKSLFFPSLVSVIIPLFLLSFKLKNKNEMIVMHEKEHPEPGSRLVLWCGIGSLIFVPIFKAVTDLPPFMGILLGLSILWLITDLMHHHDQNRKHLRVPHIFTKIDISGVIFFLGILLAIDSLEAAGVLKNVAEWLSLKFHNMAIIAVIIGFLSSVVDNVPLVAACMGMYDLQTYPTDSNFWHMIAYTAGTGGSMLLIGSAAGVALMGLEKVDFIWYMKKISISAAVGYLAGFGAYLLIRLFI